MRRLSLLLSPILLGLLLGSLLWAACGASPDVEPAPPPWPAWQPPATATVDTADDYHGTQIADPYRWLEDQDGADTAAWVRQQNAFTQGYVGGIVERPELYQRLETLWNYPRYGPPEKFGDRWIYHKNDGLQDQSVVYVTDDPGRDGEVVLDPNGLSEDGTVAVMGTAVDESGRYLAYATSESGSDWRQWQVLDLETRRTLDDRLQWSKFSGAAWTHDSQGFFYQRYEAPAAGETFQAQNRAPQLCYHRLGTPQSDDRVAYERPDEPDWGFGSTVTEDGRYLVIHVSVGTDERNRIAYVDLLQEGAAVQPLLWDFDAKYAFCGNEGDVFYFRTDKDAPNGRVIAVSLAQPQPEHWKEVVPETTDTLQRVLVIADRLLLLYLQDASHYVAIARFDGSADGEIPLPGVGTVGGFTGKRKDGVTYFLFTSFLHPPTIYRYDFANKQLEEFRAPQIDFDRSGYEVRQVFLQSGDGARISLFLVHKEGLTLDGSHPTYLYGYGGFNVSLTPRFSVPNLVWIERGGIYAQAVLRGGGEYGEDWHRAGMLESKQNVFDDFIACAEYLIRNGYTSRRRLAIGGHSNGGLLVGAAITQRPGLFAAAVPEVGVLDMLRYHLFTIGWAWVPEYGSSDDPEQFGFLRHYSPLHNTEADDYPATLIMTGDHDDRVLPGHSYKFAATLQQAQRGTAPILIRVESNTGHGAGKPTAKLIAEAADRWAFLVRALDGP